MIKSFGDYVFYKNQTKFDNPDGNGGKTVAGETLSLSPQIGLTMDNE